MARGVVTLREVAEAAGVHPGTASRALNVATRSLVRRETVERVATVAAALGYRPNYLARSFKTRRTTSVGVLVPDIANPLFPPMLRGIEDRLDRDGYVALVANTENSLERHARVLAGMLDRRVDGLICATADRDDETLTPMIDEGIPVVLFNRVLEGRPFSSVSVDDAAGVRLAVEHLSRLGHRRIAHLAGPPSYSTGADRRRGFHAGLRSLVPEAGDGLVATAREMTIPEGERCTVELLAAGPPPTAIVASNDMMALGCLTALEAAGLRCPEDVSVVGFNDMPFLDRMRPPLTTVRIPQYEMGAQAAELLLERLGNPDVPVKEVLLSPRLVVRESTAPPATG